MFFSLTKFTQKWVAAFVAVFFGANILLVPLAEANVWEERRLAALPSSFINKFPSVKPTLIKPQQTWMETTPKTTSSRPLQKILNVLSLNQVTMSEVYQAKESSNDSTLILIQDIHMNPEAQNNIAATIQSLIDSQEIDRIAVEGASGQFDFSPFYTFSDETIVREISQMGLDKNLISAPSFIGITNKESDDLFLGVDDPNHYRANIKAYQDSAEKREAVQAQLSQEGIRLNEQKRLVYSKDLLAFDALVNSYSSQKIPLGSYVKNLLIHDVDAPVVLSLFMEAYEMESKLDFKRADRERQRVIQKLAAKLSEDELSNLLAKSLAYRVGRMSYGKYYQSLKKLCEAKSISLKSYPNFDDYIRYVLLSDGIKANDLFDALESTRQKIFTQLIKTPSQKKLVKDVRTHQLAQKLIQFELTPNEWDEAKESDLASLKSFADFYREADIRSEKIFENLTQKKEGESKNTVLIMGGFHTPIFTQKLRDKNLSHIVVSPKLTKVDSISGSAYLSIFERDKTPLDQLFKGEILFLAPPHLIVGSSNGEAGPTSTVLQRRMSIAHHTRHGQPLPRDIETKTKPDGNQSYTWKGNQWETSYDAGRLSRRLAPSDSQGGIMVWLKEIILFGIFRLNDDQYEAWTKRYDIQVAPIFENALVIGVGILVGLAVFGVTGSSYWAIQIGNIFAWVLFFGLHFISGRELKTSGFNIFMAGTFSVLVISLGFLILPHAPILFALGTIFLHQLFNRVARRLSQIDPSFSQEERDDKIEPMSKEEAKTYVRSRFDESTWTSVSEAEMVQVLVNSSASIENVKSLMLAFGEDRIKKSLQNQGPAFLRLFGEILLDPQFIDYVRGLAPNVFRFARFGQQLNIENFEQLLQNLDPEVLQQLRGQKTIWDRLRDLPHRFGKFIRERREKRRGQAFDIQALVERGKKWGFWMAGLAAHFQSSRTGLSEASFSYVTISSLNQNSEKMKKVDWNNFGALLELMRSHYPQDFLTFVDKLDKDLSTVSEYPGLDSIDLSLAQHNVKRMASWNFKTTFGSLHRKVLFFLLLKSETEEKINRVMSEIYGEEIPINEINVDVLEWIAAASDDQIRALIIRKDLVKIDAPSKILKEWIEGLLRIEESQVRSVAELIAPLNPLFKSYVVDLLGSVPQGLARTLVGLGSEVYAKWQVNNQEDFKDLLTIIKNHFSSEEQGGVDSFLVEIIRKRDVGASTALHQIGNQLSEERMEPLIDYLKSDNPYKRKVRASILMSDWNEVRIIMESDASKLDQYEPFLRDFNVRIFQAFRDNGGERLITALEEIVLEAKKKVLEIITGKEVPQAIAENKTLLNQLLILVTIRNYTPSQVKFDDSEEFVDYIDNLLARVLEAGGDEGLDEWVRGLPENEKELKALLKAGYDIRLWTEGITISDAAATNNMTEEEKKDQLARHAFQIIEIAEILGVTEDIEKEDIDLSTYELAEEFIREKIYSQEEALSARIGADNFEQYRDSLESILRQYRQINAAQQEKIRTKKVRVVIKKDIIKDGNAGCGVPGCYDPHTGVNRHMPVVHGFEGNAFFAYVYDENGEQISNVVLALTDKGVVVFSEYNRSNLNLDPVWAEAWKELARLTPGVVLGTSAAGSVTMEKFGKKQAFKGQKRATLWEDGAYDFGSIDDSGNVNFDLSGAVVVTSETLENSGAERDSQQVREKWKGMLASEGQQPKVKSAAANIRSKLGPALAKDTRFKPYMRIMSRFQSEGLPASKDELGAWLREMNDQIESEVVDAMWEAIQSAVGEESGTGGILYFARDWMNKNFGWTSSKYYRNAFWLENIPVILFGFLTSAFIFFLTGTNLQLVIQIASGVAWGTFTLFHIYDLLLNFISLNRTSHKSFRRTPARNIIFSTLIASIQISLSFLPIAPLYLAIILVTSSFVTHFIVNILARRFFTPRIGLWKNSLFSDPGNVHSIVIDMDALDEGWVTSLISRLTSEEYDIGVRIVVFSERPATETWLQLAKRGLESRVDQVLSSEDEKVGDTFSKTDLEDKRDKIGRIFITGRTGQNIPTHVVKVGVQTEVDQAKFYQDDNYGFILGEQSDSEIDNLIETMLQKTSPHDPTFTLWERGNQIIYQRQTYVPATFAALLEEAENGIELYLGLRNLRQEVYDLLSYDLKSKLARNLLDIVETDTSIIFQGEEYSIPEYARIVDQSLPTLTESYILGLQRHGSAVLSELDPDIYLRVIYSSFLRHQSKVLHNIPSQNRTAVKNRVNGEELNQIKDRLFEYGERYSIPANAAPDLDLLVQIFLEGKLRKIWDGGLNNKRADPVSGTYGAGKHGDYFIIPNIKTKGNYAYVVPEAADREALVRILAELRQAGIPYDLDRINTVFTYQEFINALENSSVEPGTFPETPTVMGEILNVNSVYDALIRWMKSRPALRPLYWLLTIILAPAWETGVFHVWGLSMALGYFSSPVTALLVLALIFAASHTLIEAAVGLYKEGLGAFRFRSALIGTGSFLVRALASIVFSIPFLVMNPYAAAGLVFLVHAGINFLIVARKVRLPILSALHPIVRAVVFMGSEETDLDQIVVLLNSYSFDSLQDGMDNFLWRDRSDRRLREEGYRLYRQLSDEDQQWVQSRVNLIGRAELQINELALYSIEADIPIQQWFQYINNLLNNRIYPGMQPEILLKLSTKFNEVFRAKIFDRETLLRLYEKSARTWSSTFRYDKTRTPDTRAEIESFSTHVNQILWVQAGGEYYRVRVVQDEGNWTVRVQPFSNVQGNPVGEEQAFPFESNENQSARTQFWFGRAEAEADLDNNNHVHTPSKFASRWHLMVRMQILPGGRLIINFNSLARNGYAVVGEQAVRERKVLKPGEKTEILSGQAAEVTMSDTASVLLEPDRELERYQVIRRNKDDDGASTLYRDEAPTIDEPVVVGRENYIFRDNESTDPGHVVLEQSGTRYTVRNEASGKQIVVDIITPTLLNGTPIQQSFQIPPPLLEKNGDSAAQAKQAEWELYIQIRNLIEIRWEEIEESKREDQIAKEIVRVFKPARERGVPPAAISRLRQMARIQIQARQRNIILKLNRQPDARMMDMMNEVLEAINEIPMGILEKLSEPMTYWISEAWYFGPQADVNIEESVGAANLYASQHEVSEIGQAGFSPRKVRMSLNHELVHKLATIRNPDNADLLFPVRDWLDLLIHQGMTTIVLEKEGSNEKREVPIQEHLDPSQDFNALVMKIRKMRGRHFKGDANTYNKDPHEIVAWNATGEGEERGGFGKDHPGILEILERTLLRSFDGKTIFRFDPEEGGWWEINVPASESDLLMDSTKDAAYLDDWGDAWAYDEVRRRVARWYAPDYEFEDSFRLGTFWKAHRGHWSQKISIVVLWISTLSVPLATPFLPVVIVRVLMISLVLMSVLIPIIVSLKKPRSPEKSALDETDSLEVAPKPSQNYILRVVVNGLFILFAFGLPDYFIHTFVLVISAISVVSMFLYTALLKRTRLPQVAKDHFQILFVPQWAAHTVINFVMPALFDKSELTTQQTYDAAQGRQSPEDIAALLKEILISPDRAQAKVNAILSLSALDRVFDRSTNLDPQVQADWRRVSNLLLQEFTLLAQSGNVDQAEVQIRLADLYQVLQTVLSAPEVDRFVGDLKKIPTRGRANQAFLTWANKEAQVDQLVNDVLDQPAAKMIIGVDASQEGLLEQLQQKYAGLIKEGRLQLVNGRADMNLMGLFEASREIIGDQEKPIYNFLMREGVSLPAGFFDLNETDWSLLEKNFYFYFINAALLAVELNRSQLPNWALTRQILIQA